MKTLKTFFVAFFAVASFAASAQTADEIVTKYVNAMGGAEKLASLKTVKMEGSMSVQETDVLVTITKKHLHGIRLDLEMMGTSNFQIATATKGWIFMPVMQQTEPKEMTADELKAVQSQMDVQGPLFNYKEKGYSLESMGLEKVDGKDAHKLKMIRDGKDVFYFIDAGTGLIVKTLTRVFSEGEEKDIESTYNDYRKNEQGFMFAYSNTNAQALIIFDKISANIPVDDKIFTN